MLKIRIKNIKFLGVAVLFCLIFSLSGVKVYAETLIETPAKGNIFSLIDPANVAIYKPECVPSDGIAGTYLGSQFAALVDIPQTISGGAATFAPFTCASISGTLSQLYEKNQNQGVLNYITALSSNLLDQRPLSTQDYIQNKIYALQGKVFAAEPAPYSPGGTGYDLLKPIQAFWGWSVNIVFGILILIIIGIAFAIVFRQKIGGKEIVQIQNAIPSIALAMILVPLSYSISGVFVDAIAIGTNVVHSFFFAPGAPAYSLYEQRNQIPGCSDSATQSTGTTDDPCDRGLYADDDRVNVWNIKDILDVRSEASELAKTSIAGNSIDNFIVMKIIKGILDFLSGKTRSPAYWFGEIINAIVGILMIWISIKIAWRLFKKYITLILAPLLAPFIFASVAVPGSSTKQIMNYLKLMGSASLLYIVTYLMFILSYVFTSGILDQQMPSFQRGIFIPPLLGLKDLFASIPTGTSQSFTDILFGVIGIAIFFSIPNTLDQIDKSMGGEFKIPGFITTPLDSLKESWRVTTRTAPAFGAKAINVGAKNVVNTGRGVIGARMKAISAFERLQGKTPGELGTREAKVKEQFTNERLDLLEQLNQANGDIVKTQQIKGALSALDQREIALFGKTVTKGEEGKVQALKASITYFSSDGGAARKYAFSNAEIEDLFARANASPTTPITLAIGEIVLEAENFNIPLPPELNILVGKVVEVENTSDKKFGEVLSGVKILSGQKPFGPESSERLMPADKSKTLTPNPNIFFSVTGGISSPNDLRPDKTQRKVKFGMSLTIGVQAGSFRVDRTLKELFGTSPNFAGGLLSGNNIIQTPERAFQIKSFKSDVIKLQIGTQGR